MNIKEYLDKVAHIEVVQYFPDEERSIYVSNFDGSYIAQVGMEQCVKFLADREITEGLTHGVGYSPRDGKWYGWSHRAICGFKVGSACKKGDCHYIASTIEEELEAAKAFWSYRHHTNVTAKKINEGVIQISWTYTNSVPNVALRLKNATQLWQYNFNFGRGEWVAETIEDAKQMAIDFNKGVS